MHKSKRQLLPVYEFSSDFLKNAPVLFHSHLANLVKSFFVHGFIPSKLLGATLVLLVKDKLGDVCSASKYRSIAISSLILKIIDWVILLNYGHLLKTNNFQFGFQPGSNTSLCTWMVYETIDMFLRAGSIVYGCLLDCTKAFDTVQHSRLFSILLESNSQSQVERRIFQRNTNKDWCEARGCNFPNILRFLYGQIILSFRAF